MGLRDSSSALNCSHPVTSPRRTASGAQVIGCDRTGAFSARAIQCAAKGLTALEVKYHKANVTYHLVKVTMCLAAFFALLLAGCTDCKFLAEKCPPPPDPQWAAESPSPNPNYLIGCPDVLEITFLDYPQWDVLVSVDLDGRLPLEFPGQPRVEGRKIDDIRNELAQLANVPPDRVSVQLVAARSSRIYMHGPIRGRTRIVPYQGPEPVIDFLKRVGGLPPGSKLSQVYVVRPNVAFGERTEVFRVDVPRVLIGNDQTTNVTLKPSDQVYVGETRGSVFARLLPDWLAPVYRDLVGLLPDDWWPRNKLRPRVP